MLQLSIQDYEGKTTVIPLAEGELSIGRAEGADICFTERNVSRKHAKVITQGGRVWVENIAATYGTRLNSTLLREKVEISAGDLIQIGDYQLSVQGAGTVKKDTALVDDQATTGAPPPPDNATAIVNLADLQAALSAPAGDATGVPTAEQPRLVVESDNLRGWEGRVSRSPTVLGRTADSADLVIDHRSISKEHARLTRKPDGSWEVLDLGSANGIQVNGEHYSKSALRSGDKLTLGHVTFRFLAAGETAPITGASGGGGGKGIILIVVALIAVGLAGAAGYFFLAGGKAKSEAPKKTEDAAKKAVAADDSDNDNADERDEEASDTTESVASVLERLTRLEDKGRYGDALQRAMAAQKRHSGDVQLRLRMKKLQDAALQEQKLAKLQAAVEDSPKRVMDDVEDMMESLKSLPPLARRAQGLKATATKNYVTTLATKAQSALKRGDARSAKDTAEMCIALDPSNTVCSQVMVKAKRLVVDKPSVKRDSGGGKGRRQARAEAAPTKPKPAPVVEKKPDTPAPSAGGSMTAKELYRAGRTAALSNKAEAVKLFELATKKGYRRAHGKLARLYYQLGKMSKCAFHGKKYLDFYPSAGDAPQIQGLVEKCE